MLEFILKFFGWAFVVIPLVAFLSVSIWILKGTAGDDPVIMSLIALGFTMFIIGAILLLLVYLTGFFEPSTSMALLLG